MTTEPEDQHPAEDLVGTVVHGKYLLTGLLGYGGMGAVYAAQNAATGRNVAVKLLLSRELMGNREFVKRFFREARASAAVDSDHVVQVFDSGEDPETRYPYMVMEVLKGEDLADVITRHAPIPPQIAAKIMLQAATGLACAHEAGIIHRDIKPANLFLTVRDNGRLVVKLLDFGIAKVKMENFLETGGGNLTRTGSMLGTPLYMSPEQVVNASRIDPKSDVWSLATVMFELLTGSQPFAQVETLGELMLAILNQDLPFVQDLAPWVPAELAAILHRAMAREARHRYRDGSELRDALALYLNADTELHESMIAKLPEADRRYVAPRLTGVEETLAAPPTHRDRPAGFDSTKGAMSVTADPPTVAEKKRGSRAAVIGASAGAAALVAAGVVAWAMTRSTVEAAVEEPVMSSLPVEPTASAPVAPRVERTFLLRVRPEDAEAWVDGEPAKMREGRLPVKGPLGKQRLVKIKHAWGEIEKTVTIAETGLVPDELEIAEPEAKPAGTSRPGPPPGTRTTPTTTARPPAPATTTAPPKPTATATTKIRTDEGEFH